jgi:hypothetical protein
MLVSFRERINTKDFGLTLNLIYVTHSITTFFRTNYY